MKESISFDRAADIYDATRVLPGEVAQGITDAFLREILAAGADRVLEIGVGTGRIARPLLAAGVSVTGLDISRQMMSRLQDQLTDGHNKPDLVLGDATRLPLCDGSFRAAVAVHVLHLVSSPPAVIAELRRVLSPGGVFLHQTRRPEDAATERYWTQTTDWWGAALGARRFQRRQRPEPEDIRIMAQATGASLRIEDVGCEAYGHKIEGDIQDIRDRTHSWTWEIPDHLLDALLPEFEEWLHEQFGDGDLTDRVAYELEVYTWR
jgi:ubiquinone/menaquinone biosynthesis C-methylase UbiE